MKIAYRGRRSHPKNIVEVVCTDDLIFDLPHLVRHSPTGFEWGYAGSGPAELARCILLDVLGTESPLAELLYQKFICSVFS